MKTEDVYRRLKKAYKANKGIRLSAEEVEQLYLMDTAIQTVSDDEESEAKP